jgi:soluble lytic murein transglycosylase-like protein
VRAIGVPETRPIDVTSPAVARSATEGFLQELARALLRITGGVAARLPVEEAATGEIGPRPSSGLQALIAAAARQERIPPALLAAVARVESGFQPRAVSRAGAKGLTQLMDDTAHALGVTDSFDPWQNLVGGARYLRLLLDRYGGDVTLALAAYNAGPGAVDAAGRRVPPYPETQAYVQRVIAAYVDLAANPRGEKTA